MSSDNTTYLLEKLIRNKLSGEELDAFLAGLANPEVAQAYTALLEAYFQELIDQHAGKPLSENEPQSLLLPNQEDG